MILEKGKVAPDFELNATPDQKIKLNDFKGKNVILAFYPADWSPVCGDQMALYNEMLKYFSKHDAQMIGISVDSTWCHNAFQKDRKLHFPLLVGESKRALFVIDKEGKIAWSYLSPTAVNPGADGILDALESLEQK